MDKFSLFYLIFIISTIFFHIFIKKISIFKILWSFKVLHQEREDMIARQVQKMQEESKMMMQRYVEESKKREEMLQREQVQCLFYF